VEVIGLILANRAMATEVAMGYEYAGVRRVACVGAGLIGSSWAAFYLSRGLDVIASDVRPKAENELRAYVDSAWPVLERLGIVEGASKDRLSFTTDMALAVESADLVQESGPEQIDIKTVLLAEIDRASSLDALIISSASGHPMTELQRLCDHPERCVLGHPFNPPHIIPLVEVVGGAKTAPASVLRTVEFYKSVGKAPILLRKEINGHVTNRLQSALWREAVHLIAEDIVTVADIDVAISHASALRWAILGPGLTYHLGGGQGGLQKALRLNMGGSDKNWSSLGQPVLTPELKAKIIRQVEDEAGDRSIADLEQERDEKLLAILVALKSSRGT
jgi:carnitine 3-dehydrogenase